MDGEIPGKQRQQKVVASPKNVDFESIWKSKQKREFHLLLIYLVVMATVSIAWVIGYFEYSFAWLMIPFVLLLSLWRYKVFRIVEEHLFQEQILVHRKRALRGSETAEWMNLILNRWALFSSQGLSDLVKRKLNPVLAQFKPSILESVQIKSFSLGEHAPFVQHIQVFEVSDGLPGGRKQASWLSVGDPPKELKKLEKYQIVMDMQAGLHCEQFKMVLQTKLAGLPGGPDILVENLKVQGRLHAIPTMSSDIAFPHIAKISFSFIEKPSIWFSVKILKTFQVMDIPLLKSWIHNFVMDLISLTLVDPYKFDLDMKSDRPMVGPTPVKPKTKANAKGVLTVTVKGDPGNREPSSDDTKFCVLKVGSQSYSTDDTPLRQGWQDTCSFLINDVKAEKLVLKVKSRKMLSNITLASYDLKLGNYAFDENNNIEAVLDEKEADLDTKLTLCLEYTPLPPILLDLVPPTQIDIPQREVSGVVYLCIHGGVNLLALDKSGTSDPYCVVFANRKKIFTTHYVMETRNPKWEVSYEFFVEDFSQTTLTFLLYDWDGNEACDDDFMGATHLSLTPEEPWVVHNSLNLGYNILNIGEITHNTNLGCIWVSAIFRPVEAVKRSENSRISVETTMGNLADEVIGRKASAHDPSSRRKKVMLRQYSVRSRSVDHDLESPTRTSPGVDVFKLLSQGHGILELNIIKARDLMAMDKNGFSDPYCVVKIGKEKKFQTTVKKKTLNPVWDESVTTQMPAGDEKLEIILWDKDPLMMKDFLGELSFTADEIKRLSSIGEPGWFLLQKTKTGQVQIQLKVITEDMKGALSEMATYADPHNMSSASDLLQSTPEDQPKDDETVVLRHDLENSSSLPRKGKKKKLININRSHSDVQVHKAGKFRLFRSKSQGTHKGHDSGDELDSFRHAESKPKKRRFQFPFFKKKTRLNSLDKASALSDFRDPHGAEKYFDVKGQVLQLKIGEEAVGIRNTLYCKIRVDSRTESQRSQKFSAGRVVSKTPSVKQENNTCIFDHPFEIDKGGGIPMDTLFILDVKTTQKNQHIATRGYTLRQLFDEHFQVSKWITLENDIEVEIGLTRSETQTHPKSRPLSFLSLGSLKKKRESTPLIDQRSNHSEVEL